MKKKTSKKKAVQFIIIMSIIISCIFLVYMGVAFAAIVENNIVFADSKEIQNTHISGLKNLYENNYHKKKDEQEFCDFSLIKTLANNSKINELQYIATHNSYKQGLSTITRFAYHTLLPRTCGKKYDYNFETLTSQLNHGIRSFEIDIYKVKDKEDFHFECIHDGRFDKKSSIPDPAKGLLELKMWSDAHPNHLPIFILIEPKGKLPIGGYENFDAKAYDKFDTLIRTTMRQKLLTPNDMLLDCNDFEELRSKNAYPSIKDSLNKFIFILHETETTKYYLSTKKVKDRAMFMSSTSYKKENTKDYKDIALLILNELPNQYTNIEKAAEENFLIRTRLDTYGKHTKEAYKAGCLSRATLLSTDYPPCDKKTEAYECVLPSGKTITHKPRWH